MPPSPRRPEEAVGRDVAIEIECRRSPGGAVHATSALRAAASQASLGTGQHRAAKCQLHISKAVAA